MFFRLWFNFIRRLFFSHLMRKSVDVNLIGKFAGRIKLFVKRIYSLLKSIVYAYFAVCRGFRGDVVIACRVVGIGKRLFA